MKLIITMEDRPYSKTPGVKIPEATWRLFAAWCDALGLTLDEGVNHATASGITLIALRKDTIR